ncbi:hypothetical protein AB0L34_21540 [Micromonospora sp. NPDC052213]|uniref:hypothetical protein n=1 Tax=Micromonospora sp. NPDC052213 TaxID=3155812 RepID=UPI003415F660
MHSNAAASTDGLTIRRGGTVITISWDSVRSATVTGTSRTYLRDARRRVHTLRVPHDGRIEVRITLP